MASGISLTPPLFPEEKLHRLPFILRDHFSLIGPVSGIEPEYSPGCPAEVLPVTTVVLLTQPQYCQNLITRSSFLVIISRLP